jgi:hypothetical protein
MQFAPCPSIFTVKRIRFERRSYHFGCRYAEKAHTNVSVSRLPTTMDAADTLVPGRPP